jgi:SAM-dependent methyltransferase
VSAWYTTYFEGPYLRDVAPMIAPEATRIQIDAIRAWLNLTGAMHVLDLACGQGRHALALAIEGLTVTGQDLSSHLLGLAAVAQQTAGTHVTWRRGDMRKIPERDTFDAVISMFSAFGYFPEDDDNVAVLQGVAAALAPGGRFLIDLNNREPAVISGTRQRHWEPQDDGSTRLEERTYDLLTGRMGIQVTRIDSGKSETSEQWLRLYTLPELITLLRLVGLAPTGVWGDFDGQDYTLTSPRMIVRAVKPLADDR